MQDLLAIKALPPLSERRSRRKTKASLVQTPLSPAAWLALFGYTQRHEINQLEIRPLGGRLHPVGATPRPSRRVCFGYSAGVFAYRSHRKCDESRGVTPYILAVTTGGSQVIGRMYTTEASPLLRGHMFEFHYASSWAANGSETRLEIRKRDAELVGRMNAIAADFNRQFLNASFLAYAGYGDWDLQAPAADWFGAENAAKLAALRRKYDPLDALYSSAARYMYPS